MNWMHTKEYRLYRLFWLVVPLGLALVAYAFPVLGPPPLVRIEVTESVPNYLYLAGEEINLSFQSIDLDTTDLVAEWWFGDTVLVRTDGPTDSGAIRLVPRVAWDKGNNDSLGLPALGLSYDTLQLRPDDRWEAMASRQGKSPTVKFPQPGQYRLRLRVTDTRNDRSLEHSQLLEIHRPPPISRHDTTLLIIGPRTGLVEEELVFYAGGTQSKYWYWKFGDGKNLDADRQQVVYSYDNEGTYTIRMKTDLSDEWYQHTVVISPTWNPDSLPEEDVDTSAVMLEMIMIDLKKHLQAIADLNSDEEELYYYHKNVIESKYIPVEYRPIRVQVNEEELPLDFDSYCQRIHFLEGKLSIQELEIEWVSDVRAGLIRGLNVKQQ